MDANNQIKITHFVNPHVFYFRWMRDEGFDEELHNLEEIIANTVKSRTTENSVKSDGSAQSDGSAASSGSATSNGSENGKMRIGDVVALFVADWNRWIRASIRRKENAEQYCVWAIDYGVPMVAKSTDIVKLPSSFKGIHLDGRIKLGGIENCMPAEIKYDISTASSVKEKLSNWTTDSIELAQRVLQNSMKLEFENVHEYRPQSKPHLFGRLMMQRQDKQMLNVVKCLLDMNMAALTEGNFEDELKELDSIKQLNYLSAKGDILHTKMVVSPFLVAKENKNGCTEKEMFDDESVVMDENLSEFLNENEYFDESVSMMKPKSAEATEEQNGSNVSNKNNIASKNGSSTQSTHKPSTNGNYHQNSGNFHRKDDRKDFRRPVMNNFRQQHYPIQRDFNHGRPNVPPFPFNQPFNGMFQTFIPQQLVQMENHIDQRRGRSHPQQYTNPRRPPHNRNGPPRVLNGDPEFVASLGRPQNASYNYPGASHNKRMNMPFHQSYQGHGPKTEHIPRNQMSDRSQNNTHNRYRKPQKNIASESRPNNGQKNGATDTSIEEIEAKTTEMKLNKESNGNEPKVNNLPKVA